MTTFTLALRSLRYRTTGFVASFVALFLGAVVLMSFASMMDTAFAGGVPATTRETLTLMAGVVGGWGLVIVTFTVSSTLGLLVGQRNTEMAVLKGVGATPAQVGRLIVGEAAVVALVAALAAVPVAMVTGGLLLDVLKDTGQAAAGTVHQFGPIAIGVGAGVTFVAATIAAWFTARRATRVRAREAALVAAVDSPRLGGKRRAAGLVLVGIGVSCGAVTGTVVKDMGLEGMAIAGQAAIMSSIGLAVLAPALGRAGIAVLARPVRWFAGVGGYLTVLNVRQRSRQMGGVLVPIILFTGMATGTLYMQGIENSVTEGTVKSADQQSVETLNFVVVGMIALFAAIMLVNTLVAATIHRRREFGQHRLVGSTPPQVLGMVGVEGAVLTAIGVLFGTLASAVAIVPYSLARTNSLIPDTTIGIYLAIVATAAMLTFAASLGAAGRAIRTPAVRAITA